MNLTKLPTSDAREGALSDVAVLMPAYNGQDDVVRTLASFEEDANIYALIVDDGSTPPIVAPEVPGMCVEVLRMAKNGGIERALQAGVEALAARGFRYAARIDGMLFTSTFCCACQRS